MFAISDFEVYFVLLITAAATITMGIIGLSLYKDEYNYNKIMNDENMNDIDFMLEELRIHKDYLISLKVEETVEYKKKLIELREQTDSLIDRLDRGYE